jgi:hypothetical protein
MRTLVTAASSCTLHVGLILIMVVHTCAMSALQPLLLLLVSPSNWIMSPTYSFRLGHRYAVHESLRRNTSNSDNNNKHWETT